MLASLTQAGHIDGFSLLSALLAVDLYRQSAAPPLLSVRKKRQSGPTAASRQTTRSGGRLRPDLKGFLGSDTGFRRRSPSPRLFLPT
ncbi:hypothetical protein AOLI_G00239270 [Acnodon oligacanthus]